VNADEGASWNDLHSRFEMKRINHDEAYSADGACTNMAEEFFSRMRRAEIGHHHHIAGTYLLRYAQERHGARITAALPMVAIKPVRLRRWRWGGDRQSISVDTGRGTSKWPELHLPLPRSLPRR
jgi:ISXO2-like transposase domain